MLAARKLLAKITPADLEQNQQARYWQAKIDASQGVNLSIDFTARVNCSGTAAEWRERKNSRILMPPGERSPP
ncbi:hypothetical protein MJK71_25220 [Escherichia coli]|nr:hypothetical protein MJK71_25220 [Escherichia coli]